MVDRNLIYEDLKRWILHLPDVREAPHRFGGTEFQIGGVEFMHSHGPSFLDIRLSKTDQEMVLKSGDALPHRFAPHAGWVSFRIENEQDLDRARRIIRLAYDDAKRNLEDVRSRRVRAGL